VKRYTILFLAVLVLALIAAEASAKNNATVTTSGVNIRPAPSINTGVITRVSGGTRVQVLAHTDFSETLDGFTGCWNYIDYRGIKGYVFGKYIQLDEGVSIPSESEYRKGD
jgi:uncharacterized protein YraI